MANSEVNIRWEAPEFEFYPKTASWYWLTFIAAILLLTFAVWQKNFLFTVFVIIAEIMILAWSREKPHTFSFVINDDGILIGDALHQFKDLLHFSILERDDRLSDLLLANKQRFGRHLKILIYTDMIKEIREALLARLEEEEYKEPLPDSIFRIIKF